MVAPPGWLEAVANPIRLRIVRHLSGCSSASVDDIAESVNAPRSTVRGHLRALMEAGVVASIAGDTEGRLGRPPILWRLERRQLPRGAAPSPGQARNVRSPVSVAVRDYPGTVPGWTLRESRWAAAAYLLESRWLAHESRPYVDYDRRKIEWQLIEREARSWPASSRLLAEIARGLWAGEPRGSVSMVAQILTPEQRGRVLAAIALAAGDATVVGLSSRPTEADAVAG